VQKTAERGGRRVKVRPVLVHSSIPTVSVVICCFNYARYLPQAVQSCIGQQDVLVDVIIVDDASTDDSLAVAQALAKRHPNVSVLSNAENAGPVQAFNEGARTAIGEFLVRLDADDLLTPGSLSRATLVAQAFPSVGLVYGHPLHFSGQLLPKPRLRATAWTVWPGLEWLTDRCRTGRNVITSPEVLMRRSLLDDVGYLAPLAHSHDMELWLRLSAFSDVAYIHGADQAWHREHLASLSAKSVNELVDLRERVAAFDVLFAGPVANRPEADALSAIAKKTLAKEAVRTARHEYDIGAHDGPLYSYCLGLATTLDPGIIHSYLWSRLNRPSRGKLGSPSLRLASIASRLHGRIRSELQWRRWHRKGVY